MAEKIVISHLLEENRDWKVARNVKPEHNQRVVMRLFNPNIIFDETDTEIYPAEDLKIGRFIQGLGDPNGMWIVDPPFPRYDFSTLTNKESLKEGTVVTHWAIPSERELELWDRRFRQINLFKKLVLEVDEEHEEMVYKALTYGASFINRMCPDDPQAIILATFLYDLQYIIDTHQNINLTDEEYKKLIVERSKEINDRSPENKDDES